MANDKPCFHLPLDEIRYEKGAAQAPNAGGIGSAAIVRGNPSILHDPTMGTCMHFNGDGDYVELTDLSALTFAQGMTVMAWVRFEDITNFNTIFVFNVERNQSSRIIWAANRPNSSQLILGINGKQLSVENSIGLQQWRHYAFVYEPSDKVTILIDGAVVFSREAAFDIANAPWTIGYVGKSSYDGDRSSFRGSMAHFRVYNQALVPADVRNLMIGDKSAMAYYRETTLLKVDLYTVRDDDHKPILYVEADNKGEPLEVSLTNPGDKPVTFESFGAPTADDFHVQLRFRRNVIAPNVLRALQAPTGVVIDGWQHAAGTTADGREDYISFVKRDDQAPTLDKGAAWRIQLPNFSAAAQGGARNTRVQVRYRTELQDPGSVVRHMEVQSHLGLKTIPLIARFRGSNMLLNNGTTSNELTIEVVCLNDTGSVRLDDASKFELIVDDELLETVENGKVKSVSSLEATSQPDWLEPQPVADGIGHKTIAIKVKRPADGQTGAAAPAPLMEVSRGQPLTFALSNWVTDKPSGAYNILLRYENIPGYWDGAWVLPVQFSPLLLRSDKIGIGTDEPGADLEIRRDANGAVGPVLRLTNEEGGENSAAALDFNVGPAGQGAAHDPTFRIEGRNDANGRTDLVFVGKTAPDKDSRLEERVRITADGRVGIATDEPGADLEIRRDAKGAVGPVLRLTNAEGYQENTAEGGPNTAGAIDFNIGPHGQGENHSPTFRIEGRMVENNETAPVFLETDLVFLSQKGPQANGELSSELKESMRITAAGRVKDSSGFVTPVGAIIAYGGSEAPEGWLLCDGGSIVGEKYAALRKVLGGRNNVPDLQSRFIVGAGQGNGLSKYESHAPGGDETVTLTVEQMPSHNHTVNPGGYHQFKQENIHYDGDPSWGAEDRTVFMPGDERSERFPDFIRPTGGHKDNDEVWSGTTQPHKNLPPYYALTYIIKF